MKQFKNLLFLSLILLCWTLVSCKSSKTSSGWSLIWEENFNQKKSFDSQVWSKIPRGKSDWNNYMTDFDSCYAMRKGKLVLRGIVNHTQRNDTAPYLIGGVYTKGKKAFTNGRIEICDTSNKDWQDIQKSDGIPQGYRHSFPIIALLSRPDSVTIFSSLLQETFINRFFVSCLVSSSTEKLWISFHGNEYKQWNTCCIK